MTNKIKVLTTNQAKLNDFQNILSPEIMIESLDIDLFETQTLDQCEIVARKAMEAYFKIHQPLCVDDFGLYIPKYYDFPGALTKFIFKTLDYKGLIKLIDENEPAYYKNIIGYIDKNGIQYFEGVLKGHLTRTIPKNFESNTPLNSIFIPEGYTQPFSIACKNKNFISHRTKALENLKKFLLQ